MFAQHSAAQEHLISDPLHCWSRDAPHHGNLSTAHSQWEALREHVPCL